MSRPKAGLTTLVALIALVAVGSPAAAQSPAPATVAVCITVTGNAPPSGWDSPSLVAALFGGTVTLTVVPCETPAVVTDPGLPYNDFLSHESEALDRLQTVLSMPTDTLAQDRRAFVAMRTWASDERDWLASHDPQSCYQDEFDMLSRLRTDATSASALAIRAIDRNNMPLIKQATAKGKAMDSDISAMNGMNFTDACALVPTT